MHKHYKIIITILLFTFGGYATAQSKEETALRRERSNLEKTSDPVDRTKIEIKIADFLITMMTTAARAGDDKVVEQHLKDYSNTIQDAHQTMMKSGKDAHKHPAGFKDLEIMLRKHQSRLADVSRLLAYDERDSIEKVRKLVSNLDDQLVKVMLLKESNAAGKP